MFWMNSYASSTHVESLLSKQDFTLFELLDVDDIIQECKSQNKKLIEFITRPEIMKELVMLTTEEPSIELEERRRYKYPNIACELLTCDLPPINEKLAGDEVLMSKLYSFIDTEEPLNPLLASFFSKTIGVLVARSSDQVVEFLKSRQRCVDLLLHHLETSAIMDLLLKLVSQVEGSDLKQNILSWLDSQQLVQRLIKLLSSEAGSTKHANASQLLCDMITEGREYKFSLAERPIDIIDPIVHRLESAETVTLLLETILTGEKVESSIVGGIEVLFALLNQKTKCASSEADRGANPLEEFLKEELREQCHQISNATIPFLEQLNKLLLDPPHKPPVSTTIGVLDVPFGNTRLHVVKLFVTLLFTEKQMDSSKQCCFINEKLMDLGTFQIILDLFFKYSFNSLLHAQVKEFFQLAIDCNYSPETNELIYEHIFVKCKLIERILEGWKENDKRKNEKAGIRQAYMGHLIDIANNLVLEYLKNDDLNSFMKSKLPEETLSEWESFVSTELEEIKNIQLIMLGGPSEVYMQNFADNSDVYSNPQEVVAQQVYSNYQEQQLGSQYVSYSIHDQKYIDGDEALHSNTVGQLNTISFILNDEDLSKGEDRFSKLCFQNRKSLGEDDGPMNWGDGSEITFQSVQDREEGFSTKKSHDSSSSEEEEEEDPCDMEIDSNETGINAVLPEVNPWDLGSVEPVEQTGWANFDNFESTLNIESKPAPEPFQATFSDVIQTPLPNIPEESVNELQLSECTNSNDSNGSGDKPTINSVEANLPQLVQANFTEKMNNTCLDSVNTPDSNANPVTISRTPAVTEARKDVKDIVQNSLENVKPLTDQST